MTENRSILVGLSLIMACASNPPPPMIGDGPAPDRRATTESDRSTGIATIAPALDYRAVVLLERHDSIVLALPDGQHQVQRLARRARFTLQIGANGDLHIRLDSLRFTPALADAGKEAVGTTWSGRLGPHGIEELHANRDNGMIRDMESTVAELLPSLPRSGARVGSAWSDTAATGRRVEIFDATDQRRSRWTVGRVTSIDGLQVYPITVSERYEQLGEGVQAGRTMRMSSQGSRNATYYVTLGGRTDQATIADSVNRLITIPDTRQAIPTTQVIRTKLTFRYR